MQIEGLLRDITAVESVSGPDVCDERRKIPRKQQKTAVPRGFCPCASSLFQILLRCFDHVIFRFPFQVSSVYKNERVLGAGTAV